MAILALSLIVFTLSLSVAVFGRNREGLYAEPGRPETEAPLKPECCRWGQSAASAGGSEKALE